VIPTVDPPYYAVIFASRHKGDDPEYAVIADRMMELAADQPGFLGMDSVREPGGSGITVCYWRDLASIRGWKEQAEHRHAQELGRQRFYSGFELCIARVEHRYAWEGQQP
jgi:heme-degrading monooxygenase HmoA